MERSLVSYMDTANRPIFNFQPLRICPLHTSNSRCHRWPCYAVDHPIIETQGEIELSHSNAIDRGFRLEPNEASSVVSEQESA